MDTLQQVQQLRDRIKELEEDVESLKCCGNCNEYRSYPACHFCTRGTNKCPPVVDNWKLKVGK